MFVALCVLWLFIPANVFSASAPARNRALRQQKLPDGAFEYFWSLVQSYGIEPPPDTPEIREACARNSILTCLDPFSGILTEQELQDVIGVATENHGAVGVQYTVWNGRVVVMGIGKDTPAERAGLRPGDVITKIDGYDLTPKTFENLIEKIRGPVGTSVALWVERDSVLLSPVILLRKAIVFQSVYVYDIGEGISLIKILDFSEYMPAQLVRAVLERVGVVSTPGAIVIDPRRGKFILDFRHNHGGLTWPAYVVCALWSSNPEDIIVTLQYRSSEDTVSVKNLRGIPSGIFQSIPIVLLIDNESDST